MRIAVEPRQGVGRERLRVKHKQAAFGTGQGTVRRDDDPGSNRSYASLVTELQNAGAQDFGRTALDMLDLTRPDHDWVKLAEGIGVETAMAGDLDSLADLIRMSIARPGPFLIEVPC